MKKLMIAAAIVCAAALSQAAVANWKATAQAVMDGAGVGGQTHLYSGAAYFFDAKLITQSALFDAFAANQGLDMSKQTGYVATGAVASGNMAADSNKFSYGDQTTTDTKVYQDFFFALVDGDKIFLSNTSANNLAAGTDTANQVSFGNVGQGSVKLPTEGFVSAGQWAQTVPEPTSGLLLLLGVAGLALKRKRA